MSMKKILCILLLVLLFTCGLLGVTYVKYNNLKEKIDGKERTYDALSKMHENVSNELNKYIMNEDKISTFSWGETYFGKGNVFASNLENSVTDDPTTNYIQLLVNTPFDSSVDGIKLIHELLLSAVPTMTEFVHYDNVEITMLDKYESAVLEYCFTKEGNSYKITSILGNLEKVDTIAKSLQ